MTKACALIKLIVPGTHQNVQVHSCKISLRPAAENLAKNYLENLTVGAFEFGFSVSLSIKGCVDLDCGIIKLVSQLSSFSSVSSSSSSVSELPSIVDSLQEVIVGVGIR